MILTKLQNADINRRKYLGDGWNGIHCLLTLVEHDSGGIKGLLLLRFSIVISSALDIAINRRYMRGVRDRESMCQDLSRWSMLGTIGLFGFQHQPSGVSYVHTPRLWRHWDGLLCVVNDTTITVHPEMTETNVYFVCHGLQLDNFIGVRAWQWFLFRWIWVCGLFNYG